MFPITLILSSSNVSNQQLPQTILNAVGKSRRDRKQVKVTGEGMTNMELKNINKETVTVIKI